MNFDVMIADAVRMMSYVGIEQEAAHKKIGDAILAVMLQEVSLGVRISAPVAARPTLAADPIVTGAAPIVTPPGKYFKGTGRYAPGEDGQAREIGTWANPAGDIEAARLSKETGILHIVDPKTGDVVSMAGIESMAARSEVAQETGPLTTMGAVVADSVKPV